MGGRLLRLVGHGPHRLDGGLIFVALPRIPADVQVRVRRSGEHDHGPRVTHHGRQTGVFGSEGPDEHPVRTDRNQRAGPIEGLEFPKEHCAVWLVSKLVAGCVYSAVR